MIKLNLTVSKKRDQKIQDYTVSDVSGRIVCKTKYESQLVGYIATALKINKEDVPKKVTLHRSWRYV